MTSPTPTDTAALPNGAQRDGSLRWVSVGIYALVFVAAFEALAITTAMPLAATELDGHSLYSLAFAASLATSVVGMVIAGAWSDRNGPRVPLYAMLLLFVAGLIITSTAPTMSVLVIGRVIQGVGGGGLLVPLYVLIARVYPLDRQNAMSAGFSAAWTLPGLFGPAVAGALAETAGWRIAFLSVLVFVPPAVVMIVVPLRKHHALLGANSDTPVAWKIRPILWSALAAVAVLALAISPEFGGGLGWSIAAVALALIVVSVRPLLPRGAYRSVRGVPTVILLRLLFAAAIFGTEVYVPYLLVRDFGWSVTSAGLALTGAGLAWASAAWIQSRLRTRVSSVAMLRIGATIIVLGLLAITLVAFTDVGVALVIPMWVVAALGGGLIYPRLTALTLELAPLEEQGSTSSALAIADAIGAGVVLAIAALITSPSVDFGAVFALGALIALGTLFLSGRIVPRKAE
ncbi:MAG TPA: MFS transporter [Pseudolysinimonas sp.]|nr:MFS transporter [Pseudolysinimonas sp.]